MDLISIIVVLVLVAFVVYILTTVVPMPAQLRTVIIGIVAILLVLWVVRLLVGPVLPITVR